MFETITVSKTTLDRIRKEAEKLGISVEEYVVEVLSEGLDPRDKAKEYIETARNLLREASQELESDNIRQASEKVWGAMALALKAFAYWKEGKRLSSHAELWKYSKVLAEEFGEWALVTFQQASSMHICFYEGWCTRKHAELALKAVRKLVEKIAGVILGNI